jgi:hypothetical protein
MEPDWGKEGGIERDGCGDGSGDIIIDGGIEGNTILDEAGTVIGIPVFPFACERTLSVKLTKNKLSIDKTNRFILLYIS